MRVVLDSLDRLADGWIRTAELAVVSFSFAFVLGTLIASARISPFPPARGAGLVFVEVVRNSPLPVLIVLFWFGAPKIGIDIARFAAGVVVLALYTSAFVAETIRAGVNSVASGQAEAGRAIGLTSAQNLRVVILPQSFRAVVQPLGNIWIALVKNSAAVSFIAVPDLTYRATQVSTDEVEPIAALLAAAVGYLLITLPSEFALGVVERKTAITR